MGQISNCLLAMGQISDCLLAMGQISYCLLAMGQISGLGNCIFEHLKGGGFSVHVMIHLNTLLGLFYPCYLLCCYCHSAQVTSF